MAIVTELNEAECSALLGDSHLGRVGFVSGDHPVILPVNYVFDEGLIVFRTDPGHKLEDVPMHHVAFEIDGADDHGPWSVLAQGHAREVTTALGDVYETLRKIPIPVQAPGEKEHWVAIEITRLTGRRIRDRE